MIHHNSESVPPHFISLLSMGWYTLINFGRNSSKIKLCARKRPRFISVCLQRSCCADPHKMWLPDLLRTAVYAVFLICPIVFVSYLYSTGLLSKGHTNSNVSEIFVSFKSNALRNNEKIYDFLFVFAVESYSRCWLSSRAAYRAIGRRLHFGIASNTARQQNGGRRQQATATGLSHASIHGVVERVDCSEARQGAR